jgi:hypothetical protein
MEQDSCSAECLGRQTPTYKPLLGIFTLPLDSDLVALGYVHVSLQLLVRVQEIVTTLTTLDARISLSKKLAEFRERGISSDPLICGDRRKPEGDVLPYELYRKLEDATDQLLFDAATAVMARIEPVIANLSLDAGPLRTGS